MSGKRDREDGIELLIWKKYLPKGKYWDINYQNIELKKLFWGKYNMEKLKGSSIKKCMSVAKEFVENKSLSTGMKINYKK
ncbi:MAG: hypothetical protein IIA87_04925 [Nanoarchaeota archaeon]|nr:hypothetical protein [Nanoarchaeota archaeon]